MAEAPKFTIEIDDLASPALAEMVRKVEAAQAGRAFDRRCIADSIRSMAETMSDERYDKADTLSAFEQLAALVEGPHPFGEVVPKEPHVHDDAPHGPLWDTGEEGNDDGA